MSGATNGSPAPARGLAACLCGALLSLGAACPAAEDASGASTVLIDTDFTRVARTGREVAPGEQGADRIRGVLPPGWTDDSGWACVWVSYRPMEQEHERFLRVEVTRLDDGRAQFHHLIPDFTTPTYFRLVLRARSAAGSTAEVGIRMSGAPYRFLWRTSLALRPEWRRYAFDFKMKPNTQPVGLWINQGGVGSIDLAKVTLVRMTRQGLIAELKARYPGGGPRNLLRISRLPLGPQSGWTLGRDSSDGDDVQIAPDPQVIGPSGAPALRVCCREPADITSAPFAVPLAFETHTASLYARGKGRLRLSVVHGRAAGKGGFEFDDRKWRRVELPFHPELLTRCYGLRMTVTGELWLDAFQVARGGTAGPYASRLACEVSLSCGSPIRVQFDDQDAVVRYAVTGTAAGGILKGKVVTPYGDSAALPDVKLGAGFLNEGTWRYDRFGGRARGVFRVEAWVEDGAGAPISAPNELVIFRLRRPRYWMKDAPQSPFGTHTNSTTRHVLMAKAAGINWTRLHDAGTPYIGWYHLERKPGEWTFRDKELKRYRRYGMKVLGALSTAPEWATYLKSKHSGYFDRFYQPRRMEDFANYVRTVAKRYRGVIDDWDVWNEPWIYAWWGVGYDETKTGREGYFTSKDPQADFVRLMATAYRAAREVNPDATVLGVNSTTGGGGSTSINGREWTRGIVEHGGLVHCDVVCYHHYTGALLGYPGDGAEVGFRTATGPIAEKLGRLPKPVWMTEGSSIGGMIGDGFYNHTLPYPSGEDPFAAGDRLCRYIVSLLAQGVRKVFLYSMHCHGYFGTTEYRVLVTPEGYLHPCAAAHSAMAWLLEDTRFVRRVPCAEKVTAYLFEGAGRAVAALSPMPGHAPFTPPRAKGVEVLDLFGNPVPAGEPVGERLVYLSAAGGADGLVRLLAAAGQ